MANKNTKRKNEQHRLDSKALTGSWPQYIKPTPGRKAKVARKGAAKNTPPTLHLKIHMLPTILPIKKFANISNF